MNKELFQKNLSQIIIFLWGAIFLLFPLFFLTITTDSFLLPKQLLIGAGVLLSCILLALQIILSQKVSWKKSPFDFPIALTLLALLLSSFFSPNMWDSLIAYLPVFFAGSMYFILVHSFKKDNEFIFLLSSLLLGGCITALVAVFSYFKVYPLPFTFTHIQNFTTFGSLLEQFLFFAFLLPICIQQSLPLTKGDTQPRIVSFAAAGLVILAGALVTLVQLLSTQKPILLPFDTGFQTAFAAISQDSGRTLQGFLFGSGFGNFAAVFTRFKQAAFNVSPNWFLQFNQSSSFILELLATTGVLGFLSFLFLLFRIFTHAKKKLNNHFFFALLAFGVASFILPLSFISISLLFMLLTFFVLEDKRHNPSKYEDLEFRFVALKKGVFSFEPYSSSEKKEYYKGTAYAIAVVLVTIVAFLGFYSGSYAIANVQFQKSLSNAQNNNGIKTYQDQVSAISIFPYQSAYYRVFSQTNIALANSLASSQQKGSSPSASIQNTIVTLIQQGISAGRNATNYAPESVVNWQNLASIYRSLFGFGQNAESFAITASQQAIILDPTNPQEYVTLGGLYYQLGQWDNAIRAFQQAVNLKQDYANAYYNLGHAYEQKGDLQNALTNYQIVSQLMTNDKANKAKIDAEIAAIQAKIGTQQAPAGEKTPTTSGQATQEPLQVNQPVQQLPAQPTQIPLVSPTPTPTPGQ